MAKAVSSISDTAGRRYGFKPSTREAIIGLSDCRTNSHFSFSCMARRDHAWRVSRSNTRVEQLIDPLGATSPRMLRSHQFTGALYGPPAVRLVYVGVELVSEVRSI